MTEQTNPETGVAQEQDPFTRMSNLLNSQPEGPADEEEANEAEGSAEVQQPESQASDEVTPDDLEVEAAPVEQQSVDAFEIVHNGTQHKLTREETIKYAQQGFDYTQKTQKVAEAERFLQAKLQQIGAVEQITPHLMQELAQVKAIEAQLAQYQNVDWVQVATDDPVGYAPQRARFDVLVNAYQRAVNQYHQRSGEVQQHKAAVTADLLQREDARLPEFVPEWKDDAKKAQGKQEIVKYLQAYGMSPEHAGSYLNTAFALATAYKAAKYDQLVKAKGEKVKQLRTAPPVTKPGSASSGSAKADRAAEAMQRLRKTGSAQDATAALLNRMN